MAECNIESKNNLPMNVMNALEQLAITLTSVASSLNAIYLSDL